MKKLLYLLFLLFLIAACKTKSAIITSKAEAIKKNKYENLDKRLNSLEKKVQEQKKPNLKKIESDKPLKKMIISDNSDSDYVENPKYDSYLSEQLVSNAVGNLGSKYRTGGTTKEGFDCSGLMFATFAIFDIKLPRSSNEQSRMGLKINPKDAKKGDLIFFRTNGRHVINHVGMIIEVSSDEIKFVHSSTSSGVMISSTKEGYYKNTFAQINRILE